MLKSLSTIVATTTLLFAVSSQQVLARLGNDSERQMFEREAFLDLSQPFQHDPGFTHNACASKLIELATQEPEVKGLVVVENGKIVSEYYKDRENERTRSPIWSCTKSFTALILGAMQMDGL